jgi:hypothetical protein
MTAAAARGVSNGVIAGALGAFCVGAYVYTMRAVGQDDLDVAVAQHEAKASKAADKAASSKARK